MPNTRSASLFPTRSTVGLDLANGIERLLRTRRGMQVQIFNRHTQDVAMQDVVSACLAHDLVVFDATRERDTNNFDIAVDLLGLLPHVLVVSRNYMPLNFCGFSDDFYPSYVEGTKTNDDILTRLRTSIDELLTRRPSVDKAMVHKRGRIEIESDQFRRLRTGRAQVFISFRTKYQSATGPGFPASFRHSVSDLAKGIREGRYGEKQSASFLDGGALVYENEILTEQRRWQILSHIDSDLIRDCDEFWIYGAPDHFRSWWTIGEFASFLNCVQLLNQRKLLKIYDPNHDWVASVPIESLPELALVEISHFVHRLMLDSPTKLAPHVRTARVSKRVAALGRSRLTRPFAKVLLRPFYKLAVRHGGVPDGVQFNEFFELIVSEYYQDVIVGRGFDPEFWEQLEFLVDCADARYDDLDIRVRSPVVDFRRLFDFAGFDRIALTVDDLEREVVNVRGQHYVLRHAKPRFIFAQSDGGRDYLSTGSNLQTIPVIRFFRPGANCQG